MPVMLAPTVLLLLKKGSGENWLGKEVAEATIAGLSGLDGRELWTVGLDAGSSGSGDWNQDVALWGDTLGAGDGNGL